MPLENDPIMKRLAKLEKAIKELQGQGKYCTCCQCRNYTKKIPIKRENN